MDQLTLAGGRDDPSDRELFDDAVSGLGDDPGVEDREEPRRQQPRDPSTQRFTRRDDDQVDDQQDDDDGQDEDGGGRVPSYRQKAEADRRRAAEERETRSLRIFEQLNGRIGSLEEELRQARTPQQQEQRERPDVWRDPDAFVEDIDNRFQSVEELAEAKARDKMINYTFRQQHRARGGEFEDAYRALQHMTRNGDRVADEIVNDGDPGSALMEWYDGERMRREIGGDPDAYVERRTAERLQKDPQFRRQVAQALGYELLDDGGGYEPPARNGRSGTQTLVRLPSVNSASGRGGGGNRRGSGAQPVTDGDFFADAVAGLPSVRSRAR